MPTEDADFAADQDLAADQALAARQAEDAARDAEIRAANTFTVTLKPMHADYLRRRAADHGQSPDQHMAQIVMQFWQHDEWRRAQMGGLARPGGAPLVAA